MWDSVVFKTMLFFMSAGRSFLHEMKDKSKQQTDDRQQEETWKKEHGKTRKQGLI